MPGAVVSAACRLALKEWAVTGRALDRGEQVLLLRKGGIREETAEFRVPQPEFLLFPTYEHQRGELLKPAWQAELASTLAEPRDPAALVFSHWVQVAGSIEVTSEAAVEALSPHYIWTPDYVRQRLHWKPRSPLLVLLVRVWRLEQPQEAPVTASYAGCKSWVNLEAEIPLGRMTPVLEAAVFEAKVAAVTAALAASGSL